MEMTGNIEKGIVRLVLKGRLDMASSVSAEQFFLKYAESGKHVVLDFSGVSFIASAGIRALLTLYRSVDAKGGDVTIENPQPQVREVLEETDFAELFNLE